MCGYVIIPLMIPSFDAFVLFGFSAGAEHWCLEADAFVTLAWENIRYDHYIL